jgi:hypothetical protein
MYMMDGLTCTLLTDALTLSLSLSVYFCVAAAGRISGRPHADTGIVYTMILYARMATASER